MSDIIEELAQFSQDPLGFVLFAFPWGEPGELEHAAGPEKWQEELLIDLGRGLIDTQTAIRLATTSGHGIGKSALVSWLILWGMSTFEDTIGVVTANTETQLKTKTWAQLAKWFRLFIGKEFFDMTATKLYSRDSAHENTWRIDMVPWSERNTEAFAGLHNKGKRILLIFDEASAIPDLIFEVAEVSLTDKAQIAEWIKDYGEDSDFVRVRVRGVFPRVDSESFISFELATEAVSRTVIRSGEAIILGVDVGRFGDDPSVIFPRQGNDAVTHGVEVLFGADTMQTAARVAATFLRLRASVAMVDSGGVGGGVD